MKSLSLAVLFVFFQFPDFGEASALDPFIGSVLEVENLQTGKKFYDVLQLTSSEPPEMKYEPISHMADQAWMSVCLTSEGQTCSTNFLFRDRAEVLLGRSMGRVDVSMVTSQMPVFQVSANTAYSIEGDKLFITTTPSMMGFPQAPVRFQAKVADPFINVKTNFSTLSEDVVQRTSIKGEVQKVASLANGIVAVIGGPYSENNLAGESSGHGTGFFISSSGLMLTNYHVLSPFNECIAKLACTLEFKQVRADGNTHFFSAPIRLMAEDESNDVVLLKVDLSGLLPMSHFEIELKSIGPKVLTVGYPGDRQEDRSDSNEDHSNLTELTFSRGVLTGLNGTALATSAYIYQGASGSPVLNEESLKLIGINSNGSGFQGSDGSMPALVRSIHVLEKTFGLSSYISGELPNRVRSIVGQIRQSSDGVQAGRLMDDYLGLNTRLSLPDLINMIAEHPSQNVRSVLLRKLRGAGLIRG